MPALAPVPKVIRIRFIGTDAADADVGSSVYFSYAGTAPTSPQLVTFNGSVATAWANSIAPLADTGFSLTKIETSDLSSPSSAQAITTTSHPGTRAGTALPLNVAFTLQEQTALRRRGGHWHVQLRIGVQADTANVQNWSAAFVSTVLTEWQSFISGIAAGAWPSAGNMVTVAVQYFGPPNRTITSSTGRVRTVSTPLASPVVWPVTLFAANTRLGSQRRRLGKSGG